MEENIILIKKWAKSAGKIDIPLYHSADYKLGSGKNPTLIIGGVHGDEPEGIWLVEALLEKFEDLAQNNEHFKRPWILIPCLNPDGYTSRNRTNSKGVDLNRNFPTPDWTPTAKAERYNPGPQPNSEPETQALTKLIETEKPRLIVHCHSWKPGIIYTGSEALSHATFLSKSSGYPLQDDIGYPTPGSLGQFGWLVHKIPVICIEEREGATKEETWERFQKGFFKLFEIRP